MTKLICAYASALLLTTAAFGQDAKFVITGTQCATVSAQGRATAAYTIIGSWTGTIQPQIAIAGQAAQNTTATPTTSTTAASSITSNATYTTNISGASEFLLCGNSVTGNATIYINTSERVH